jgi:hypothetical protein
VRTGEVLREAASLYRAHWRHLLSIALVVYLGLAVVAVLAFFFFDPYVGVLIGSFIFYGGVYWTQGPIAKAVEDIRDGRADLSPSATLGEVAPRLNKLSFAGILAAVAIYVGMLLFVVPGLFLLVRWALLVPVIVLEDESFFGSFRRSWQLVKGHSWRVFGIVLVSVLVFVAAVVGGFVLVALIPGSGVASFILAVAVLFSMTAAGAAFVGIVWTLVYYRLRGLGEPAPAPAPAV